MESGEIDLYWEYTGTVLMTVMEAEEIDIKTISDLADHINEIKN